MPMPQEALQDNEFAVYFDTNHRVRAADFADFLLLLEQEARGPDNFGPEAGLFIGKIETGSLYATLEVAATIGDALNIPVVLAAVGMFLRRLATRAKQPDDPLNENLGRLMANASVVELSLRTNDVTIVIRRSELPVSEIGRNVGIGSIAPRVAPDTRPRPFPDDGRLYVIDDSEEGKTDWLPNSSGANGQIRRYVANRTGEGWLVNAGSSKLPVLSGKSYLPSLDKTVVVFGQVIVNARSEPVGFEVTDTVR